MPYADFLKRAWALTRRHKILWLFGLLAGTGGGINFGDLGGRTDRLREMGSGREMPGGMGQGMPWGDGGFGPMAMGWLQDNSGVIALVVAAAALFGLVLFVVGIAAKGGLVHLSARADDERPVLAGDGWRVGFSRWWRTLGVHLVIFLPIVAFIVVGAVVLGVTGIGAFMAWGAGRSDQAGGGLLALIGLVLLLLPLLFVATLIAALLLELALRHAILADRPALDAVGAAWNDLRGRFMDVAAMWLVMLLSGFVFAFVIAFVAGIALVPAIVAGIATESVGVGLAMGAPGLLLVLVPVSIYAAWRSTAWTLFWRQLTGLSGDAAHGGSEPPVLVTGR